MKLTKRQLRRLIKEQLSEVGGLGRVAGDENPAYELLTSMIGGVENTDMMLDAEGFQDVDPALKQQAVDAAAALHAVLSQIGKSIPRRVGISPEEPGGISPEQAGQQLAFEAKK